MNTKQLCGIIQKAVCNLPDKCREVYVLGKEKDLSYKEIAGELGISVKTVECHMSNALKRLRQFLEPYYLGN